jgi:hypothetical protein
MNDIPQDSAADETITFRGEDIRELPREDLIDAIRDAFPELVALRQRLSEEGQMAAAREEDFDREARARWNFFGSAADYQSRIFDASTAYNQLIVIGGYAAFFGVWSGFSKDLDRTVVLSSGALILISLTVYVSWTVFGMFQLGRRNIEAMASFGQGVDGFEERIQAVEVAAQQRSAIMFKFWRPVVLISGLTGFAAAALLGGAALLTMMPKLAPSSLDPLTAAVKRANAAAIKAECNARLAAAYARADAKTTASNPKTGQQAILLNNEWVVLPLCN